MGSKNFIILGLRVVPVLLVCLLWIGCQERLITVSTPTPTLTTIATPTSVPLLSPTATSTLVPTPSWRGITPGKTTRTQVMQILGTPNTVKTWGDLEAFRYYYEKDPDALPLFHDKIVLRDGIVQTLLIHVEDEVNFPSLDLRNAEMVVAYEDKFWALDDVYLYPRQGIAVLAHQITRGAPYTWAYVQYFVPMSLEQYMATWGQYHPTEEPFPIKFPGRPDHLGVVPGQTTKHSILDLYGQPDYVVKKPLLWDNRKLVEHYFYYRPRRAFNDYYEFRFVDDVVVVVEISLRGDGYTLGQAIDEYGMPEMVLRKHYGFQQYRWAFRFPQRGVVLYVPGIYRGVHLPSQRSDEVGWKYLFPPMSMEEYLGTWGSTFMDAEPGWEIVDWKGLADD